jgi:hypothetical protein
MVGATVCALTIGGCSGSGDANTSHNQDGLAASALCDGALDHSAAQGLQEVSGTDKFQEVDEKQTSGSFTELVKNLRDSTSDSDTPPRQHLCHFLPTDVKTSQAAEIKFTWSPAPSDPDFQYPGYKSSQKATAFDFSKYAVSTDNGATVDFPCSYGSDTVQEPRYMTTTLDADLLTHGNSETRRAANMRIAYSASVKLAKKIGCFKESGLPAELGTLKARAVEQ